jgi:hypothetical protein
MLNRKYYTTTPKSFTASDPSYFLAYEVGRGATKFEFVINLKAAKQIGLTLSPEFLSRANQVIK